MRPCFIQCWDEAGLYLQSIRSAEEFSQISLREAGLRADYAVVPDQPLPSDP